MFKKVFFAAIACIALVAQSIAAQTMTDIRRVSTSNERYYVVTDSGNVQVSPLVYKIVEAQPEAYQVVTVGDIQTVFEKIALVSPSTFVFEVETTSLVNDTPTVHMTNGFAFSDPDLLWLAVQPGQKVRIQRYIGLTREFTVYETVPRSTPVSGDVEQAAAPAKSKVQELLSKIKEKAQASRAEAKTPSQEATSSNQKLKLTFGQG